MTFAVASFASILHQAAPPFSLLMTISSTMAMATRVSQESLAPPAVTPTRTGSALSVSPVRCLSEVCPLTLMKVRHKTGSCDFFILQVLVLLLYQPSFFLFTCLLFCFPLSLRWNNLKLPPLWSPGGGLASQSREQILLSTERYWQRQLSPILNIHLWLVKSIYIYIKLRWCEAMIHRLNTDKPR